MSRKKSAEKREVLEDAKYGSKLVTKLANYIMQDGKKSKAERIVYGAIEDLAKITKLSPVESLIDAIKNIRPNMEVKTRRMGGANFQVPVEVNDNRGQALALRWLTKAAFARNEKTMRHKLCNELSDALNLRGAAVKKRDDTHKMAESNRAFAHYKV